MPWLVQKDDNRFCVHLKNADGTAGETIKGGCHATRDEAIAHLRALYKNAPPEKEQQGMARMEKVLGGLERGLVQRAEVGQDGLVRGTASTVCNVDRMDRVLLPGAWQASSWSVPFLLNHKDDAPLGETTFTVTPDGQLSHATEIVGDPVQPGTGVPIRDLLRKGYPATSIGWLPRKAHFGWNNVVKAAKTDPDLARQVQTAMAMGVEQSNSARYFSDVEVVENSLVPIPANPRALLEAASLLPPSDERAELEAMVEFAAGARHSAADQSAIQQIHDLASRAGATCTMEGSNSEQESGASNKGPDTDPDGQLPSDSGIKGGWHNHMHSKYTDAIERTLRDRGVDDAEEVAKEVAAALEAEDADPETAAQMSTSSINDLPDSDFAYIEPGGKKDSDGKTTPRSLRHFPIHDEAHVRNALSRAPQSPFGEKAMPKIRAAAKKFGIEVSESSGLNVTLEVAKADLWASIGAIGRELDSLD